MITVDEANEFYNGAESGHDFDHVLRVRALAERLARAEGADIDIVRAAALLHDIARSDEKEERGDDHAQMSAERAGKILRGRGVPPDRVDAVVHAIAAHRFRGAAAPQTIEAKVLFDADKLDSIGAIGIARAFAVAGALNQRLWTEVDPEAAATRNQHNSRHSPVAEFAVKLSHVRDRMHTRAGRQLAEERHKYMVGFFERLEREMRGEA